MRAVTVSSVRIAGLAERHRVPARALASLACENGCSAEAGSAGIARRRQYAEVAEDVAARTAQVGEAETGDLWSLYS